MPPRGYHADALVEQARSAARSAASTSVNIPDGPRASARMSALATAVLIEQQAGVETILHYACRDRNLLGMQSDLLGAHAMGVRNVLLVTGDPPKVGDYPDATAVFDVDSIGLTNVVARLNGGLDIGGQPIGQPTGVSHRRRGEPRRARISTRSCAASTTRWRRAPSSRSRSRSSTSPSSTRSSSASEQSRHPDPRRPHAARERCGTPSSWPTRCPASACPTRSSSGCAAPTARRPAADEGVAIAREIAARDRGRSVQGVQISTRAEGGRHGARP